jgi:hypothetical protein
VRTKSKSQQQQVPAVQTHLPRMQRP